MACLFAAGITAHILLVAGLRNPTVRARYVAVRELLADYGHVEFHEALLELLGSARISRERVSQHLAPLTEIFDAARRAIRTPFPFATDISDSGRRIAINDGFELRTLRTDGANSRMQSHTTAVSNTFTKSSDSPPAYVLLEDGVCSIAIGKYAV